MHSTADWGPQDRAFSRCADPKTSSFPLGLKSIDGRSSAGLITDFHFLNLILSEIKAQPRCHNNANKLKECPTIHHKTELERS